MHSDHLKPRVQQPLDQQPVRPLDPAKPDPKPDSRPHSARIPPHHAESGGPPRSGNPQLDQ